MDYEKITGWFDFKDVYELMVEQASERAVFIEVGAWHGKSTVCMAELIKNSGKRISFTTVDDWTGMDGKSGFQYKAHDKFCDNIEGWVNYITVLMAHSENAAHTIQSNSCDFVFIDGAHDYESVKKDIMLWLPKVKIGGYIGGHDYSKKHPGVMKAVIEVLGKNRLINIMGNSWLLRKA